MAHSYDDEGQRFDLTYRGRTQLRGELLARAIYRGEVGMDCSLADHVLARLIIPESGVLFTSLCQVKAFEADHPVE